MSKPELWLKSLKRQQDLFTEKKRDLKSACRVLACAESSAILGIHFCATPRSLLYGEFGNSIPSPLKLRKIEAIQTSLFVDVLVTVFIRNASTSKSKSISR